MTAVEGFFQFSFLYDQLVPYGPLMRSTRFKCGVFVRALISTETSF